MVLTIMARFKRCTPSIRVNTFIFILAVCCIPGFVAAQKLRSFYSPDSSLQVQFALHDSLTWHLVKDGKVLIEKGVIHYKLGNGKEPGLSPKLKQEKTSLVNETVEMQVPYRKKTIPNFYRLIQMEMQGNWSLEGRLYNEGFAYRVALNEQDSVTVVSEDATWHFPESPTLWYAHYDPRIDVDAFHTSFEGQYRIAALDTFSRERITYAPVVVTFNHGSSMLITDANLYAYPGMHLQATGTRSLQGIFAAYPALERQTAGEFPAMVVEKREPFLAKINGKQFLPFRAFLVADKAIDLPANDMLYLLGDPSKIADPSWILTGKGTDEWICGINLFNVPFKAGLNTDTYKYYIDFAKRFGFNQIMLDAGWSNYKNLFDINPDINMEELVAYAKTQNIRLMLWTLSRTLDLQLDSALLQFEKWGIRHIMTDFMDRDDQQMVEFYHRVAEACARHQISVMFHGAYPPKGFNRTWPNAITHEGVMGAEWNIWSDLATPAHNVALAYVRMPAGPLDYEPGLLLNAQPDQFRPIGRNPMSIGTRCHQLAMFVVYDSPLQIFSGNPSQGYMEPAFMEILGSIPTTWNETRYLAGEIGEYIVTAKRHGSDWYIAGMCDLTERKLTLDMSWMDKASYNSAEVTDGVNAASYGADYSIHTQNYQAGEPINVTMKPGGGFLIKLVKK